MKKFLITVATMIAALGVFASSAFAWNSKDVDVTVTASCNHIGSHYFYTFDVTVSDNTGNGWKPFEMYHLPLSASGTATSTQVTVYGSWQGHFNEYWNKTVTVETDGKCVEPPVDHPPVVTPPVDRCPPGMTPTAGKDGEPGNDECEFPKTTPAPPVATPPVVQVVYVDRPVVKTVIVVKKVKVKGKTKVIVKKVKVIKRVVVKLPKPDVPKKAPKTL